MIHANGIDIGIYTEDFQNEYMSITDIARYKSDEPKDVIKNWMRGKDTLEFLGLWEQLHNSNFKGGEFDSFRIQAGANALLSNMESYNDILIQQGKSQAERMKLLHELAVQQMKTISTLDLKCLPGI